MITEIDEAIMGSLKKGLADLVPPENFVAGSPDPKKKKYVSVENTDFTIEESGMDISDVRYEEKEDRFDADGGLKEFKLSVMPVREIMQVEQPEGTFRSAPDDYHADLFRGLVTFRDPPKKGKDAVRISYRLDRPLGESHILNFALCYTIAISSDDRGERDRITLAAIETLYRDVGSLFKQGVNDIRFERGYTADMEEGDGKLSMLEYTVMASRRIDVVYPPMDKIEITGSKK